ncbi:MAG: hypothetical protein PHC60_00365 [Heliobacteriaceae bacterium]|nr:hypothetical protein [Heliobacteriaceae bacterium]MDD4586835.1 hypothetical protein [Heliobacteriaceae bacterium]
MWGRQEKTMVHDTGFEFGQAGWFALHAVTIPVAMYAGMILLKRKRHGYF